MKINEISPQNNEFLQILTNIAKPPKKLHYIGTLPAERRPTVAIVGTRKPTAYGREVTTTLARDLANRGAVIVSGLALGVDGIAQQTAAQAGSTTIGIIANPLPDIRPATNRHIGEQIVRAGGAIIAEHGNDEDYVVGPWSFLERNRLVSGLSDAVIITEAAARSGTLNTAMHAMEQGKEVLVVPGNITSPQSSGCNALLRQGATPITSADDVLEIIAPKLITEQTVLPLGTTPLETAIIQSIAAGVRDGDELRQKAGATPAEFSTALTMLEINGVIRSLGANQWTIR